MIPDVSVVTAAYNSMPYLTRCLESVFQQSLGNDRIEMIVVDDGSTDATWEYLQQQASRRANLRLLRQPNSGGPAQPRNRALELAQGRYVYVLDSDDYLGQEALERMVRLADAESSDVVLGKQVGVGGRKSPISAFRHSLARTDVFTSRVYWTLNPMKLFRRSLIERLKLRFPPEIHRGEDQPFVARAYLNASNISVLADYDCVFTGYREDGQNFTKKPASLRARLACPRLMFALVAEHVAAGPRRDHLMTRHFQIEARKVLSHLRTEKDPNEQREAFAAVKGWVDAWYNPAIAKRLAPALQMALELVRQDGLAELLEFLEFERTHRNVAIPSEGKRVLVAKNSS